MLRRDFLRTISAFAAAAAAGGGAAAAVASSARAGVAASQPTDDGVMVPAGPRVRAAVPLDLTLVRGEEVKLFVSGLKFSPGLHVMSVILGPQHLGPWHSVYGIVEPGGDGLWIRFSGQSTSLLRPGQRPWHLSVDGSVLLAGTATILPDHLWNAEQEILAIVPQMHPLWIEPKQFSRGDYDVIFRAKTAEGERSSYTDRVASLVEHSRPVAAEIVNRGAGCRIAFSHKGLL